MTTPNPETENTWLKRLQRFFKREKKVKPKAEATSEDRDKRAFNISIGTGAFFLVIVILLSLQKNAVPTDIYDSRVAATANVIGCIISAWLARQKKTSVGIAIFLTFFFLGSLISASGNAGAGIPVAAFLMGITFAITSATMLPSTASRINLVALLVSAIPIFWDLFEPFPRKADPSPTGTTVITIIMIIGYGIVVMRRFNTYNLRTKLIIAFVAVTVLPLIGVGFYYNTKLSDTLYQNANETLGQLAGQTASSLDTFINTQLKSVYVQAQNPTFIKFLSLSSIDQKAEQEQSDVGNVLDVLLLQDTHFIYSTALLDSNGLVILNKNNVSNENTAPSQFFRQAVTEKQAEMTGPLIDPKSSKVSLYFSAPIKSKNGTLLGFLVIEYDANVVEAVVESLITSNDNSKLILFHVVDKKNFVRIVSTNNPKLLFKSYKDFSLAEVRDRQKQGLLLPGPIENALVPESEMVLALEKLTEMPLFTTVNNDETIETKYLNGGTLLQSAPWLAFVQQSESIVLASVIDQKRTTVLIFLVLIVLVTVAAFGLSQLLASPILKLAATAQRIAAGDLSLQSDIDSNDEIGTLARAFNEMTRQSRALIDSLEQRSKALATSSEVSRRISTILDQQELVTEVVKQVQTAFGYYHAHIYLLDEKTSELVMAGGTGEAGKTMLARGHKIPVGKGLVGRAAQNNFTVLVSDVAADAQWLANPLLPDTKSEIAVPISIAERVLGVLDVQHNEAGKFKQEDVDVLQSIANQVAFAVRNARSYSDVQAKADRESLITSIGQKIQGSISVESAMQIAVREIGRALNGAKAQVVLNENASVANIQNQQDEDTVAQP